MPQYIMSQEQQQKLRVWVLLFITFHLTPQTLTQSKVKSVIKAYESADVDAETAILTAFNSIGREDCIQWITHCGYH